MRAICCFVRGSTGGRWVVVFVAAFSCFLCSFLPWVSVCAGAWVGGGCFSFWFASFACVRAVATLDERVELSSV